MSEFPEKRMGDPIEEPWEFQEACEDLGGGFSEPNDEIFVCDLGGNEIVYHAYMENVGRNENNVFVYDDEPPEDEAEWSGNARNLFRRGSQIVLEDAEGNPGPPGPMYVEDATVMVDEYAIDAERTERF